MLQLAETENCADVYLSVNDKNTEAIQLYEKLEMRIKDIVYSIKMS